MKNPPRSNGHSEGNRLEHAPQGINSPAHSSRNRWLDRLIRYALVFAWVTNVAILVAALMWVFFDGRSLKNMELLTKEASTLAFIFPSAEQGSARVPSAVKLAKIAALLALATLATMFAGLFFGTQRFRGLRPWLLFVTLVCAWLGLLTTWPQLYWYGQQVRLRRHVHAYNELVRTLQAEWPDQDNEIPEIGAFLAYPIGTPTTLLLLEEVAIPDSPVNISAIERPVEMAISFELSGAERGAWLAWRADDSPPDTFIGGLDTVNQVVRYARIAPNWYLVRYETSAAPRGS